MDSSIPRRGAAGSNRLPAPPSYFNLVSHSSANALAAVLLALLMLMILMGIARTLGSVAPEWQFRVLGKKLL